MTPVQAAVPYAGRLTAEPPPLSAVTPLAAAPDTTGRLQIIMTRPDDTILRDTQLDPNGRFPGWSEVAGQLRSVASETDGSGRVVQVGFNAAGQIWAAIQDGPGSSGWLGWTAVDGQVRSVALARNADGRLELFATNGAGTVFHRTQTAVGAVTFGPWSTLPGQLTQVAAETNADGRIELIGLNAAGLIFDQRQTAPNAATWSGWQQVPGLLTSVAVARNADGRLQLFGTPPDRQSGVARARPSRAVSGRRLVLSRRRAWRRGRGRHRQRRPGPGVRPGQRRGAGDADADQSGFGGVHRVVAADPDAGRPERRTQAEGSGHPGQLGGRARDAGGPPDPDARPGDGPDRQQLVV